MQKSKKNVLPGQHAISAKARAKDLDRLEAAIASDNLGTVDRRKCAELHEQMLKGKLKTLMPAQRAWLADAVDVSKEPEYVNLASSGKAPRGAHVVVQCGRLPLDPPTRQARRWKDAP